MSTHRITYMPVGCPCCQDVYDTLDEWCDECETAVCSSCVEPWTANAGGPHEPPDVRGVCRQCWARAEARRERYEDHCVGLYMGK